MVRDHGRLMRVVGLCALAWFVTACSEAESPTVPIAASFGVVCDKDCPPPPDECDKDCPPPEETGFGRMTGGGWQIENDVRISRGLTLHCDNLLSNNLQINWAGGNSWHIRKESLENISCIDDPNYDPPPPAAPFDTFIASATGRLNGEDGSRIDFKFIDDGEPGRTDEAHFTIYAPNSTEVVLTVSGVLDGGNFQMHYDQPHGSHAPH